MVDAIMLKMRINYPDGTLMAEYPRDGNESVYMAAFLMTAEQLEIQGLGKCKIELDEPLTEGHTNTMEEI